MLWITIVILFAVLALLFALMWVYKDAKSRGDRTWMWVLICLVIGFPANLLVYLLFRKEASVECVHCGYPNVRAKARFCEECGGENMRQSTFSGLRRTRSLKFLIASGVATVLAIGGATGLSVAGAMGAYPEIFNNVSFNVVNINMNNTSRFTIGRLGSVHRSRFNFREDGQQLYGDIEFEGDAVLTVTIVQGELSQSFELTSENGSFEHSLEGFQKGRFTVELTGDGIGRLSGTMEVR